LINEIRRAKYATVIGIIECAAGRCSKMKKDDFETSAPFVTLPKRNGVRTRKQSVR
jgi:hypothetical protein